MVSDATTRDSIKFWVKYSDRKREIIKGNLVHRVGPAPREEWTGNKNKNMKKCNFNDDHIGRLAGDEFDEEDVHNSTGSKAILIYFSRLASSRSTEKIDYDFVYSLIKNGAAVNLPDKYGQTVMHEVARNWNTDVAKFLISFGGDANHPDRWGRTPLHLAAATNHADMVSCLLSYGAIPTAKTYEENQSAIHYAAKYNAVTSLKVLIEHRVDYNVRDYKGRTPLFLAAETAQEGSVSYLLDLGVGVGVFDDSGMSAIGFLIEKMPHVAYEALNQYQDTDISRREELFYLNYLEHDPAAWRRETQEPDVFAALFGGEEEQRTSQRTKKIEKIDRERLVCPTTPLEIVVKHEELKVIMHPVIQQLIKTKWTQFGQYSAIFRMLIYLTYLLIWTLLAFFLPEDGEYYSRKNNRLYWRLPLELLCVVLTGYFLMKLLKDNSISYKSYKQFCSWRKKQIHRDLKFCHPRWAQEKTFLEHELDNLYTEASCSLKDPWNMAEFIAYISVIVVVVTRITDVFMASQLSIYIHVRALVVSMILLYAQFLKIFRTFSMVGTFFTIIGYALKATGLIGGLFALVSIPYMVGFWVLFGSTWPDFREALYFVWLASLNSDSRDDSADMMEADRTMAQIMIGTYHAVSAVLCFNLYIALLTETFNQVFVNAKAYASREQAKAILNIEKSLDKKTKDKIDAFVQENCAPLATAMTATHIERSEEDLWEKVIYAIYTRINKCKDVMLGRNKDPKKEMKRKRREREEEEFLYQGVTARHEELYTLRLHIHELKCATLKLLDPDCPLPEKPLYSPLPFVAKLASFPSSTPAPSRGTGSVGDVPASSYPQDNKQPDSYQESLQFSTLEKSKNVSEQISDRQVQNLTYSNIIDDFPEVTDIPSSVGYIPERAPQSVDMHYSENEYNNSGEVELTTIHSYKTYQEPIYALPSYASWQEPSSAPHSNEGPIYQPSSNLRHVEPTYQTHGSEIYPPNPSQDLYEYGTRIESSGLRRREQSRSQTSLHTIQESTRLSSRGSCDEFALFPGGGVKEIVPGTSKHSNQEIVPGTSKHSSQDAGRQQLIDNIPHEPSETAAQTNRPRRAVSFDSTNDEKEQPVFKTPREITQHKSPYDLPPYDTEHSIKTTKDKEKDRLHGRNIKRKDPRRKKDSFTLTDDIKAIDKQTNTDVLHSHTHPHAFPHTSTYFRPYENPYIFGVPPDAASTPTEDPNLYQQEADNELFRTILNIKTSNYTYVISDEDEDEVIW